MGAHELKWSSFLREPTSVDRWLERGDVLLRRREGETLRLSRGSSDAAQREALLAAVRLLTLGAAHAKEKLQLNGDEIGERLPWTRFLPSPDRRVFLAEFLGTLEAGKIANVVLVKGEIFDENAQVAKVFVDGVLFKYAEVSK